MLSGTPLDAIPGTVGLWHLDEGVGGTTADYGGTNPGTLFNGPQWTTGEVGNALKFDGSNDFVLLKNGPILGSAPNFTVEAWVQWDGGGTTHPHQFIYSEGSFNDIIDLYLYDGVPSFTTLGANWYTASAAAPLPVGGWHHLAGVLQAGVGGTLYVDGQPVATNPNMGPGSQFAGSTNIGRFAGNGSLRYFRGSIDEVRVLTVARSAAQILADYQQGLNDEPDPDFSATGGFIFAATEGSLSDSQTVATFTGPGGAGAVSSYVASIDWGDGGPSSSGIITFSDGVFTVSGSHLYDDDGSYNIVTTITSDVGEEAWATMAAMPTPRWAPSVGAIDGVVYVAGGYNGSHLQTVQAYNTATNTWANKNNKPAVQTNAAYGVINGILYTAGGTNNSVEISSLYGYNPTTDTWTPKASMPGVARQNSGGAVMGGLFYVMGGFTIGNPTNLNYAYSPSSNSWSAALAPMPTARTGLAVAAVNGTLYAIGGLVAGGGISATVEAYDPASNTWSSKAAMPTAREDFDVAVIDGIIYAVGGTNLASQFSTVEAYDPAKNTWTTHESMPTARIALVTVEVNSVIYAIGGYNNFPGGTALGTNERLSIVSSSVSATSTAHVSAANQPPIANAHGPYTVNEGGALVLDASHSTDPDQPNTSLTYLWDLDNDGEFGETGIPAMHGNEVGMHATFSAAGLDGPSTHNISLRVLDDVGLSSTDTASIDISNWAPSAHFSNGDEESLGTPVTVSFSEPSDLSPADVAAGFHYAFALDADSLAGANYANSGADTSTSVSFTDGLFQHTIYGRILDKDDGYADYTTVVHQWLLTPPSPTEGISTGRVVVFRFSAEEENPGDGTIYWGDGTSSLASMADGSITRNDDGTFSAWGEHTYLYAATGLVFSVAGNDEESRSYSATINVANAPLALVSLTPPSATEGIATGSIVVAQFTDANPNGTAAEYTATITWGDGLESTASASDGTLVLNSDGSFSVLGNHTYASAATDLTFAVSIRDEGGAETGGSATIDVAAAPNHVPVANHDHVTMATTAITVNVLANDTDADGDVLRVIEVTQGADGTAEINSDGTVTYTVQMYFNSVQEFRYTVSDGRGGMATATVRLRVNPLVGISALITQVSQLDLNNGTINSLTAKLRSAQQSLTRGNINAATNQLNAFLNEISALKRSRRLTAATADAFFFQVQPILELISSEI